MLARHLAGAESPLVQNIRIFSFAAQEEFKKTPCLHPEEVKCGQRKVKRVHLMFQDGGLAESAIRGGVGRPSGVDLMSTQSRENIHFFLCGKPLWRDNDSLILPEVNRACMMSMFTEIATRHPGDLILMLMDQASCFKYRN